MQSPQLFCSSSSLSLLPLLPPGKREKGPTRYVAEFSFPFGTYRTGIKRFRFFALRGEEEQRGKCDICGRLFQSIATKGEKLFLQLHLCSYAKNYSESKSIRSNASVQGFSKELLSGLVFLFKAEPTGLWKGGVTVVLGTDLKCHPMCSTHIHYQSIFEQSNKVLDLVFVVPFYRNFAACGPRKKVFWAILPPLSCRKFDVRSIDFDVIYWSKTI